MALVSAVATLLGALFLCLGTGGPDGGTDRHLARHAVTAADAPAGALGVFADDDTTRQYVCPYERGNCSLFPSLSPAVLSAPPLDPPLHAAGRAARPGQPSGDGTAPHPDARPRAPDLHVLQVLRT
ncbi:hypothetical protein [Streptomyces sp. NPDC090025]|uniref:hypothetical protein n=1 Tax=Streptomyces sp. NPDC090025 TaxID=3365922 RepID=UPI003832692B